MIGKYKIVSLIAEGGMGAVYKAEHPTLNRFVALKKLSMRGSAAFAERFRREARIMMDFKNDRIVDVYDHFKEKSSYYIVEEYVDGISLDKLIRRERYLPNDPALLIFLECCRALKYAHDQGVVHLDIKPGNLLISRSGHVKLSDFGVATSGEEEEDGLTREGMTLGTLSYMPPEQIRNSRNVDRRADIYSMGAMLYEMVTGKPPFPGQFTPEVINLIQKGAYRPPRRLNPRVSPLVRRIIRKTMRVNPARRYQDLGEVIRLLERYLRGKDPAAVRDAVRRYVGGEAVQRLPRRRKPFMQWVLIGLAAVLVAGAAAWYVLFPLGYFYEIFRASDYGVLSVSVRIQKGNKPPEQIYLQGSLFREEGSEIRPLPNIRMDFRQDRDRETPGSLVMRTGRLWLKPGDYRVKIKLEHRLYWQSFHLGPRLVQRENMATAEGRQIEIAADSWPGLPLAVHLEVLDRSSGRDITSSTSVHLYRNQTWVPLDARVAATLKSGNNYLFRLQRENYYPQTFNLAVDPYQADLFIRASLAPLPGTLRLVSDTAGLSVQLDHSRLYLSGGKTPEYRRLEPTVEGAQTLILPPGEHLLTVGRASAQRRELRFRLEPGGTRTILIEYDREADLIELSAKEEGE